MFYTIKCNIHHTIDWLRGIRKDDVGIEYELSEKSKKGNSTFTLVESIIFNLLYTRFNVMPA